MRTRVTLQIVREIEAFRLRYACDDCVHFDADGVRCSHGYPLGERKRVLCEGDEIVFCKEFEG